MLGDPNSFLILAFLLLVSRFFKRASWVLQRFFIPSALIAGIAGLIIGPQLLGTVPQHIADQWAQWPKYLITVVFAGLFLGKNIPKWREIWRASGPMIAFGNTLAWGQYVLGTALTLFILVPIFDANPLAGSLIEIGFEGGHGTAAGLAPSFEQLGWTEGTDIALGLATVSLTAAILSGVILINWRNRHHGYLIGKKAWQHQQRVLIRSGYNLLRFGKKVNTNPKAIFINIMAFVIAIAIGLVLFNALQFIENLALAPFTDIRFVQYVPLFPFAMIGGLLLQIFLKKIGRQHLIHRRTAHIFSAIALDLLIACAVATVSLSVLRNNLAIFIILAVAGILWILLCFAVLAPRMFSKYWFENGITNIGQSMGMTATGLLLNRLADPSNKTKAKEGFAYKQLVFEPFMGGGIVTAISAICIYEFGLGAVLVVSTAVMIFWLVVGLGLGAKRRKRSR